MSSKEPRNPFALKIVPATPPAGKVRVRLTAGGAHGAAGKDELVDVDPNMAKHLIASKLAVPA